MVRNAEPFNFSFIECGHLHRQSRSLHISILIVPSKQGLIVEGIFHTAIPTESSFFISHSPFRLAVSKSLRNVSLLRAWYIHLIPYQFHFYYYIYGIAIPCHRGYKATQMKASFSTIMSNTNFLLALFLYLP